MKQGFGGKPELRDLKKGAIGEQETGFVNLTPLMTEEGVQYYDARSVTDEDTLRQLLRSNLPLRFDWENKWLRGDQYAHMLNHIDAYQAVFGMKKMREKEHPENIYV
jgi:hypothetical protein